MRAGVLVALLLGGCLDGGAPDRPATGDLGGATLATALAVASPAIAVSDRAHRTSEFAVARDPTDPYHIVAAAMDWDGGAGVVQCAVFVTFDGGRTWTVVGALPGHEASHEDTDPWVAIDDTGRVYVTCTEAGAGLLLGESSDGGLSWSTAKPVPTGGVPVKDAIGAFGDGELYLCFQQGTLRVLHSTDRGATWTEKSFPSLAGCNGIVRTPDGRVVVVYQGGGAIEADRPSPPPPILGVVATADHGVSWTDTRIAQDLGTAPANEPGLPQPAAPSLAASPVTGSIFVAAQQYQNGEIVGPLGTGSRAQGLLFRSRDGGATFESLEMPAGRSEDCIDCHVVHPTIAVDDLGRLVAQYTLSDGTSTTKQVYVSVSNDEGVTWLDPLRVAATGITDSFLNPKNFLGELGNEPIGEVILEALGDPTSIPAVAQSQASHATWPLTHRDGGEYWGIASTPDGVVAMWVQHAFEGQNVIMARLVTVVSSSASSPE